MFHDTCAVFKSYSAERKSDFCNKHKSQKMSARYFNHRPQMQLTGNPPHSSTANVATVIICITNGSSEPIPHHALIASGPVPGISNQVVSFNAQNQQANLPATDYFQEVFQCDPHMLTVFQGNPQQLNLFYPGIISSQSSRVSST